MKLNRLSLNVVGLNRIGLNRIGSPSRGSSSGSDRPYIAPEVLASLKAVCICYGKSNDDPYRAIVKNLVDPDNPFVISNAAYEGMSGYNGYPIILSGTNSTYQDKASYANIVGDDKNIINITRISFNTAAIFSYIKQNGTLTDYNRNIESFKVKVTGIDYSKFVIKYSYISGTNATERTVISITSDGTYELPKSFASDGSLTSDNVWIGLNFTKQSTDIPDIIEDVNVTIEVLPEFEGAFVTDGIDDLITSTKTVQEMLGGSNEITVVSMAHFIKGESNAPEICRINQIRRDTRSIRNSISKIGKSGIFGYTYKNGVTTINNILGDKNDCTAEGNLDGIVAPFSVEGYYYNNNSNPLELCSIAWYWTIIANKVLTTDQINQVIAYFNLDRTLNPDILCNTIKQGITNENHAEFGDKLIDFSGNGRDIQLNNIAWKGDSGIGKYNYTYNDRIRTYNKCPANGYATLINPTRQAVNGDLSFTISGSYKETVIIEIGEEQADGKLIFTNYRNGTFTHKMKDTTQYVRFRLHNNSTDVNIGELTVEFIPSHAGALCLDGVTDFGQFEGNLGLKDYTLIVDREYPKIWSDQVPISAGVSNYNNSPFMFETGVISSAAYSFGQGSVIPSLTANDRKISYQSSYVYNGNSIKRGTSTDTGNGLSISAPVAQYTNLVLYSLMLFPYSMSEFLIERQLKKHKLGTLYPDMVEWRPIVKSNLPYSSISYSVNPGEYISVDSMVTITITLQNTSDKLMEVLCNAISDISISGDNGVYEITGKIVKSPQKINMIISSYLTMLSNSTLISNETLIKNE